jgi:hypothetical protein
MGNWILNRVEISKHLLLRNRTIANRLYLSITFVLWERRFNSYNDILYNILKFLLLVIIMYLAVFEMFYSWSSLQLEASLSTFARENYWPLGPFNSPPSFLPVYWNMILNAAIQFVSRVHRGFHHVVYSTVNRKSPRTSNLPPANTFLRLPLSRTLLEKSNPRSAATLSNFKSFGIIDRTDRPHTRAARINIALWFPVFAWWCINPSTACFLLSRWLFSLNEYIRSGWIGRCKNSWRVQLALGTHFFFRHAQPSCERARIVRPRFKKPKTC